MSIAVINNLNRNDLFRKLMSRTLTEITPADCIGLTYLGQYILYNTQSLLYADFGNYVQDFAYASVYNCTNLLTIYMGTGVTRIRNLAFASCSSLTSITILATTPPTLDNAAAFDQTNDCPIYVPAASVTAYQTASNWSSLASRIQAIPE